MTGKSTAEANKARRVFGMRTVETLIMSIVAGAFSSYVAIRIIETKVENIQNNIAQLTLDIREIRNVVLQRK